MCWLSSSLFLVILLLKEVFVWRCRAELVNFLFFSFNSLLWSCCDRVLASVAPYLLLPRLTDRSIEESIDLWRSAGRSFWTKRQSFVSIEDELDQGPVTWRRRSFGLRSAQLERAALWCLLLLRYWFYCEAVIGSWLSFWSSSSDRVEFGPWEGENGGFSNAVEFWWFSTSEIFSMIHLWCWGVFMLQVLEIKS